MATLRRRVAVHRVTGRSTRPPRLKSVYASCHGPPPSLVNTNDDARIQCLLRDRWIDYPRAFQALEQLERLFVTPRRERMPYLLLHGDSSIGKTQITLGPSRMKPSEAGSAALPIVIG
ncbi:TniB family NTP-binding protein [Caballeronia humi]|uniref:TniB family NTP-binding protein n=1 Tax=Caballeronia humi TaxID=326474 RepID=UPI001F1C9DD9